MLQEAEQLQHKNLIQIKWADGYRGSDIERIRYRLEDKEKFYALYQQEVDAEFLPKQEKIRLYQEFLRNQLAQVKNCGFVHITRICWNDRKINEKRSSGIISG